MTDPQPTLTHACALAAGDFIGAGRLVALLLQPASASERRATLHDFVTAKSRRGDTGALACMIYLVADALSLDEALALGEAALATGTQADDILIAQADILHRRGRPQGSVALMEKYLTAQRSTAYIGKLVDFHRNSGLGFVGEALLRRLIATGRADLLPRLAEHYIEFRQWRSARELIGSVAPADRGAYLSYLHGRAAVSLLLRDEVAAALAQLQSGDEEAQRYAALLADLWHWRIAVDKRVAQPPPQEFPPLLAQEAARLIGGDSVRGSTLAEAAPAPGVVSLLGIGMQRTATTWLWHQLSLHPRLRKLSFKEPAYFADVFASIESAPVGLRRSPLDEPALEYWRGPTRNLHDYYRLFSSDGLWTADISPAYGELPEECVAEMARLLGRQTKALLSVRDPVERAWSNLKFDCNLAGIDPASLSAKQRRAHFTMPASRRRGDYATVLQTWQRHFADIHIVFHDDVARDPQAAMDGVWRWLGYETLPILAPPLNASSGEAMPAEDRDFLFSLYQPVYAQCEASLRGPALQWRQRQQRLLRENR